MKKMFKFLPVFVMAMVCVGFCSCGDDEEENENGTNELNGAVVGTWQGEYDGYDSKQSTTVYIRRELNIKSDGTYTNKVGGNTYGSGSNYDEWEDESGTCYTTDGQVYYNPISARRVDFRNKEMSEYEKSAYSERIEIGNDGTWITKDENLGVSYTMKKQ